MTARTGKAATKISKVNPWELQLLISTIGTDKLPDNERTVFETVLLSSSDVWTGWIDGNFACVWGLCPPTILSDRAYLWLYTTDRVKGNEFVFVRQSQIAMREMLQHFKTIYGYCAEGADASRRWLRLLGARFDEPSEGRVPFQIKAWN